MTAWTTGLSSVFGYNDDRILASDMQLLTEYMTNDAVFTVADINARSMQKLPWRVYATDAQEAKKWHAEAITKPEADKLRERGSLLPEVDWAIRHGTLYELRDHPWQQTLDDQGTDAAGPVLRYWTSINIDIFGAAYWYFKHMQPVRTDIRKLQPFQSMVKLDSSGHIVEFMFMPYFPGNTTTLLIPPKQIVAFRVPGPVLADAERHPGLRSGYRMAHASYGWTRWQDAMMTNRARPDAVFTPKEIISSKSEIRRLEGLFNQKNLGNQSGRVMVSEKPGEITPLSYPLADINSLKINQEAVRRIAGVFGVPEALLSKDSTYANAKAAFDQHARLTLLPRCALMEFYLYQFSRVVYGDKICAIFDSPIPDDIKNKVLATNALVAAGSIKINEVRASFGYDPISQGNALATPIKPQLTDPNIAGKPPKESQPDRVATADRVPEENEGRERAILPAVTKEPEIIAVSTVVPDRKKIDVDELIKINEAVSRGRLMRSVAINSVCHVYGLEQKEAAQLVGYPVEKRDKKKKPEKTEPKKPTILNRDDSMESQFVKAYVSWLLSLRPGIRGQTPEFGGPATENVVAMQGQLTKAAADEAQKQIKEAHPDAETSPMTVAEADAIAKAQMDKWGPLMWEATVNGINKIEAANPEMPKQQAEDEYFGSIDQRAYDIASDQAFRSRSVGHKWAIDKAGGTMVWRTAEDEKVCPFCAALDGVPAINGQFPYGAAMIEGPQDSHTNCRCYIDYQGV